MNKNEPIISFIQQSTGVDISKYDESFLNKSIQKRLTATGYDSESAYSAFLKHNEEEANLLINSLSICYSEFFRNSLTFAVLEHIILPAIISEKKNSGRKDIRIWSAACAGGQETYSIAMLLEEIMNHSRNKINYRIFATDQSEEQVCNAQKGMYSGNELNQLNAKRLGQWFTRQGELYKVKKELKKHVNFSVFDLFSEQLSSPPASIYGDFDLVICANLLFYYKDEYQKIILNKTGNSLAKGGYLLCGETERDILMKNNYNEVFLQSAIFRKMERG